MAFKKVTSGLNNGNDVIDEILTFITADLDVPWTTESNKNTTSTTTITQSGQAGRNTWVSQVPSQPNGFAHKGIISPDPVRMYIGMRNVSNGPGIQLNGTGFHDPLASPIGDWWTGQGNLLEARPVGDAASSVVPPYVGMENSGPYTSLYMFGPNNPGSPIDHAIPHYVYFVVEFTPGRFAHGMFGEFKKFVDFEGGWGFSGHDHNGNDTVDNLNNHTMWNEVRSASSGDMWVAANVGQVSKVGGGPSRWFRTNNTLNNAGSTLVPYAMLQWGHIQNRDFMTGPSQAKLSGFFPLVQPMLTLLDSDSTAGKNVDDDAQIRMPACFPEDFFLGDISPYEPGVDAVVGGITVVPFPVTSKLGTTPRSNYGGYFYRKRV